MKKISTLFKKDPKDLGRVINEVNPENQWVIDGMGVATQKFDGIASAIFDGELYKRLDVKKGKQAPLSAIPCQEADEITGHHPHWIKCERTNPSDKVFFEAFDLLVFDKAYKSSKELDGTYELCGESISTERFKAKFNVEGLVGHRLLRHGSVILEINDLSFDGLEEYLSNPDNDIEGIVFYHKMDARMCKLRKKDFGIERIKPVK